MPKTKISQKKFHLKKVQQKNATKKINKLFYKKKLPRKRSVNKF